MSDMIYLEWLDGYLGGSQDSYYCESGDSKGSGKLNLLFTRIKNFFQKLIKSITDFFAEKRMQSVLKSKPDPKAKIKVDMRNKKVADEAEKSLAELDRCKTGEQAENVKKKFLTKKKAILGVAAVTTISAIVGLGWLNHSKNEQLKKVNAQYDLTRKNFDKLQADYKKLYDKNELDKLEFRADKASDDVKIMQLTKENKRLKENYSDTKNKLQEIGTKYKNEVADRKESEYIMGKTVDLLATRQTLLSEYASSLKKHAKGLEEEIAEALNLIANGENITLNRMQKDLDRGVNAMDIAVNAKWDPDRYVDNK
jgi:hypothetical protein